jgi:hypothetical protein
MTQKKTVEFVKVIASDLPLNVPIILKRTATGRVGYTIISKKKKTT